MAAEDVKSRASPAPSADDSTNNPTRRPSHKEYKFFRSFSAKVENWPMRKAEALWRKMRERKIAGMISIIKMSFEKLNENCINCYGF